MYESLVELYTKIVILQNLVLYIKIFYLFAILTLLGPN